MHSIFFDINNTTIGLVFALFLTMVIALFFCIRFVLKILNFKINYCKNLLLFLISIVVVLLLLHLSYKITGKGLLEL